ncbi:MAG: nucleoside-diphosphate sugar epimerase/dehydratase [Deltaproteobacteria bacterium]|nr:nucleoside-diphosphate sugar epimerase/dehydratase [Deltaproteobacteria bacterium]
MATISRPSEALKIIGKIPDKVYFAIVDSVMLAIAVYLSFVLRLETFDVSSFEMVILILTASLSCINPLVFRVTGVYSIVWRYSSIEEMLKLIASVTLAVLLACIVTVFIGVLHPDNYFLPRSIPFILLSVAIPLIVYPRAIMRIVAIWQIRRQNHNNGAHKKTLIIGAGSAGSLIMREIRLNPQLSLDIIGFLDDDPAKDRQFIHGKMVLGDLKSIKEVVETYQVEQVIIAMPTAPGRAVRKIVDFCNNANLPVKVMPGIYELLNGNVSVNSLRPVQIEDLLRREMVQTNVSSTAGIIKGKRILVSGAGGSIGSELCRQIWRLDPEMLILLGHGENSIFNIHNELQESWHRSGQKNIGARLQPVIADVRFPERLRAVFEEFHPEIVFHTAAHKHVPLMEINPGEAVINNVLGTHYLLETCQSFWVERFLLISTDKAVRPASIMGATKRLAELLVQRAAATSQKPYVCVRFGNVLGSRGSVLLKFKEQLAMGGPLTITHPDMERYFMTIPEAVHLVIQAASLGKGGEVFVLDMGEPVKIVDLAKDLIKLSGKVPGRDIDIVFTGVRPGEKLREELFLPSEDYHHTQHPKIYVAEADRCSQSMLHDLMEELRDSALVNDQERMKSLFFKLIPDLHLCNLKAVNYEQSFAGHGQAAS